MPRDTIISSFGVCIDVRNERTSIVSMTLLTLLLSCYHTLHCQFYISILLAELSWCKLTVKEGKGGLRGIFNLSKVLFLGIILDTQASTSIQNRIMIIIATKGLNVKVDSDVSIWIFVTDASLDQFIDRQYIGIRLKQWWDIAHPSPPTPSDSESSELMQTKDR